MKKIAVTVFAVIGLLFTMLMLGVWSNRDWWDTKYTFDEVKIDMLDGTCVTGKVDKWLDFVNSDVIQVVVNGDTYLTHYSNVVLIDRK